jgi:hypothetical protein
MHFKVLGCEKVKKKKNNIKITDHRLESLENWGQNTKKKMGRVVGKIYTI